MQSVEAGCRKDFGVQSLQLEALFRVQLSGKTVIHSASRVKSQVSMTGKLGKRLAESLIVFAST